MFFQFLIIVLGFILLIYGADLLVKGASGVAKKFNVSNFIIGLTIVALGTSLPELIITFISANNHTSDLIIGNVIGSNLCNLLLILGLVAVIQPIQFEKTTTQYSLPILILMNVLVFIFSITPLSNETHFIDFKEGVVLLIIAFIYLLFPFITYLKNKDHLIDSSTTYHESTSLFKNLIYLLIGGFALKYGGDFVVDSSIQIANYLHISESIIGLTMIAFGTSLPELVTCLVAIIKGNEDIAEGNIIGSCMINFTLILGSGVIMSDIHTNGQYIENLVLLIGATTLIWLYSLSNSKNLLKRTHGFVLLIIFSIYFLRLFLI